MPPSSTPTVRQLRLLVQLNSGWVIRQISAGLDAIAPTYASTQRERLRSGERALLVERGWAAASEYEEAFEITALGRLILYEVFGGEVSFIDARPVAAEPPRPIDAGSRVHPHTVSEVASALRDLAQVSGSVLPDDVRDAMRARLLRDVFGSLDPGPTSAPGPAPEPDGLVIEDLPVIRAALVRCRSAGFDREPEYDRLIAKIERVIAQDTQHWVISLLPGGEAYTHGSLERLSRLLDQMNVLDALRVHRVEPERCPLCFVADAARAASHEGSRSLRPHRPGLAGVDLDDLDDLDDLASSFP